MRSQIILNENWYVHQLDTDTPELEALALRAQDSQIGWFSARMPAQVHEILLEGGQIPDPHVSKNAADCTWVGESAWVYATSFLSPAAQGPVFLCLDGLDTLATVYLNRQELGRFENMHRKYRVAVDHALRPAGENNQLLIVFRSAARYIRQEEEKWGRQPGISDKRYLRKCSSDFDSYMGARPSHINVGVFDQVYLDIPNGAWLENVHVRSTLLDQYTRARITVAFDTAGEPGGVRWRVTDPQSQPVLEGRQAAGEKAFDFILENPRLWWPHTHGEPALYQLQLDLLAGEEVIDRRLISFGVREVKVVLHDTESAENRFAFEVNGQRIFLRGACWAPLEGMTHVWDPARAQRLLDLVVQGQMNVMRVWAEGVVPHDTFYEACDQRGILIWQDFMFGYNKHPSSVPGFAENVRSEVEDVVRRLRNHACLLLWCGGNENYMGWDFAFHTPADEGWEIFSQVMPDTVARLDPDRIFHRSSPFGGAPAPNWPLEGDWHDYTTITFSPEASVPLFASEIGRVSAPSIASLRRFMNEQELWPAGFDARILKPGQPAWPPMWGYRAPDGAWSKVGALEAFCDPTSPEDLVRGLGTAHGQYLQQRVERERRGVPDGAPQGSRRCWGNIIWRLNDSWPILYWSVVDYYLEPKIPYYFLKRAYAPVLVCFEQTSDRIFVWVVNDSPEPVSGRLSARRINFHGEVLGELEVQAAVAPGDAQRCLDLTPFGPVSLYDDFLVAEFEGRQNIHLLRGERYLHLPEAHLAVQMVEGGLEIVSDVFAHQVSLETPGAAGVVFDDNFFDLLPGQKKQVRLVSSAGVERVIARAVNAAPIEALRSRRLPASRR